MDKRLERILPRVQKPARYVGGEFNAIMKDKSKVDTRVAFCFPDTYEIGMSNLGMRILYGVMNNIEGVWCERCFAPWGDMEQEMRNANIPLYALESFDPIKDFDIIAFSIGYEMAFPAMVDMLDLAACRCTRANARRSHRSLSRAARRCTTANPSRILSILLLSARARRWMSSSSSCTVRRGERAGASTSFSCAPRRSRASMCRAFTTLSTTTTARSSPSRQTRVRPRSS